MTRIKLCGMTREQDIEVLNEILPDYMGFVFYEKSKRNVSMERAKELKRLLNPNIKTVGVFVNATLEFVTQLYREQIIEIAQLHGQEDDAYIRALQEMGILVIKVYPVDAEHIEAARNSIADMIMFDPGKGDGETFAWEQIRDIERPLFLAGGLHADNVTEAIRIANPFAVDVSSGIETGPYKDPEKMRKFVEKVREVSK